MPLWNRRSAGSSLLSVLALAGCAGVAPQESPDPLRELAAADPMFGGGASFEHRIRAAVDLAARGKAADRDAWLAAQHGPHDRAAEVLVRAQVPEELARSVQPFLESGAGHALVHAELLALSYRHVADDFPQTTAAWF